MREYQSACFEYAHGIIDNQKNLIFSMWGPLCAIPSIKVIYSSPRGYWITIFFLKNYRTEACHSRNIMFLLVPKWIFKLTLSRQAEIPKCIGSSCSQSIYWWYEIMWQRTNYELCHGCGQRTKGIDVGALFDLGPMWTQILVTVNS